MKVKRSEEGAHSLLHVILVTEMETELHERGSEDFQDILQELWEGRSW
jgi:hypothetical protein